MQLEKQIIVDKIEVKELGVVHAEIALCVKQGDQSVKQILHSVVIAPGEDYSNQDPKVQSMCEAVHTSEVIAAYKASQNA
jgi:hypothetical protein